jgi:hypothetical protein
MEGIKMNKVKEERVTDLSIIMDMIAGKTPYYSIRYKNVGEDDYNIGYSSFNLKTVLGCIDEYFEIVESDKQTNADRIRNMSDEELADTLFDSCLEVMHIDECPYADNVGVCKKCILNWLQSEAE